MILTQKETMLLEDLKHQEQLCIDKYNKHALSANDAQLKGLFTSLAQTEQQHLNTIDTILKGTVPAMGQSSSPQQDTCFSPTYGPSMNDENKKNDAYLCTDALSAEKHVSSVYNTAVFEFKDPKIRDALNHIQKEEQEHGKKIYDYMAANGMYN